MIGLAAVVMIASVSGLLLLGRGNATATLAQSRASPSPPAATSSAAAAGGASGGTLLVEISTPPNLVGPQTVHWIDLHGAQVAAHQLPTNEAVLGAGGGHVLVYRGDGHVLDLRRDGSDAGVGQGMPATTARGATTVPVRALVSPDGTQWLWGQIVSQPGSNVTSTLTLAGIGAPARMVAQATEEGHALEPYRWTLADPLVAHAAVGVGGYLLFDEAAGQVDKLSLASGAQTPVGPARPEAVDLAGSGARAYIENKAAATTRLLTVSGPGERGLSAILPSNGQAGGLMFDPSSSHLVFASSPANSPGHEHLETDVLDLISGARSTFGPADLRPATWLPDGRLVEFRTSADGDGVPGTYLVALDGTALRISPYARIAGVLKALGAP